MKKFLALVLAFAMVFTSIPVVFADTEVSAEAKALALLGMLEGDGGGVTVEYTSKELTRLGAAAALLKLKGLYDEAIAFQGEDNFADVKDYAWVEGRNLMAYLKANPALGFGGDEKGNFNPGAMINEQSYYKVLLETLGYKQTTAEVTGDFAWEEVFTFAESIGLMPAKVEKFTIDHLAKATFAALQAKTKDGKVYIDTLIAAGVVKEEDAIAAGLIEEKPVLEAALKSAVALGNTVVEVTFDGPVNAGAEDVTLYEIDGLTVEEAIVTGEDTVRLTTSAQEAGKKYTLVVGDVKVNFGGKAKVSGAPELKKVLGTDTERVELEFDKTLDFVTATDVANYEIKGVEIVKAELDDDTVTLVTNGLAANKTHTIKVTGVKSVDGVALKSATKSFYAKSDKTAPKVESAKALTWKRVLVKFNEELDKETAENVENYVISGLTVEKAELKADDDDEYTLVELTTSAQKGGTTYTLKVSGVKDASVLGNAIVKEQSVKFSSKSEDKNGPSVTKVEVLNRNKVLVTFSDASRLDFDTVQNVQNYEFDKDVTVENAEMTPGYDEDTKTAILTVSDLAEKTYYKVTISGVCDEYGNEMKEVTKTVNYYDKDLNAAKIDKVVATKKNEVKVYFDDYINATTAKDVANYSFNKSIGTPVSAKINSELKVVTLKVNELEEGTTYKLTIDGLMDLAGNTLTTSASFVALTTENDIEGPEVEDITVINENVLRVTFSEPIKAVGAVGSSSTITATITKADGTGTKVLPLGAVYDDNTVLEFTNTSGFEDIEYTLVKFDNVTDEAGNAYVLDLDNVNFWGNTVEPDDIDFSWEQVNVGKYKFVFSEKVDLKSGGYLASNFEPDSDEKDDFNMSTVWYLNRTVAVDKAAYDKDINDTFKSYHGYSILNTEEEDENKTTIIASLEDDEIPYIESVKAVYRDEVEITFNEDIRVSAPGAYKISFYDDKGKLKEYSFSGSSLDVDDNVVTINLGSKLTLQSKYDYTLTVTTPAKDLAGNSSEKDEEYSFMGTDLVRPGNYISGVAFTNGSVFTVKFASKVKDAVSVKVYELNSNGSYALKLVDTTVGAGNDSVKFDLKQLSNPEIAITDLVDAALVAGKTYKVVTDKVGSYEFNGIVDDVNLDQDFDSDAGEFTIVVSYDEAVSTDVVYVRYFDGTAYQLLTLGTSDFDADDNAFKCTLTGATDDYFVDKVTVFSTDDLGNEVLPLYYYVK